jgi:hypothetical protein
VIQKIWVYFRPNRVLRTNAKSVGDVLRACFDVAELGEHPNAICLNGSEIGASLRESMDEEKQGRLWGESLKLVRLREGDIVL